MKNFIAGLGLGIATGLLFAPARGSQTRRRIAKHASDTFDSAQSLVRDRDRAIELVRSGAAKFGREAEALLEQGRAQIESAMNFRSDAERLNTATREELMGVYGIGPVLAARIIEGRPYRSSVELIDRGIVPQGTFQNLKDQLLDREAS